MKNPLEEQIMTGSYYNRGKKWKPSIEKGRVPQESEYYIGWDKIFLILSFSPPAHCLISNPSLAGVASTLQPYLAPGVL